MNPLDALVLDLIRRRGEPVEPATVAVLLTRGRKLEPGEFVALCLVAECSLDRLRLAGHLYQGADGMFMEPVKTEKSPQP